MSLRAPAVSLVTVNCYSLGNSAPGNPCDGCQVELNSTTIGDIADGQCRVITPTPNNPNGSSFKYIVTNSAVVVYGCSDTACQSCSVGGSVRGNRHQ